MSVLRHDGIRLQDGADATVAAHKRALVGHHVYHLENLKKRGLCERHNSEKSKQATDTVRMAVPQ